MLLALFVRHTPSRLKIAINTRLLLPGKLEGIGWFTWETLRRMVRDHPSDEFVLLFDRPWDPAFIPGPNVRAVQVPPQARHPLLYLIWFEWMLPMVLRRIRPDVFLTPDGYMPRGLRMPSLAVIHDLNFEHFPEGLPPLESRFYRHFFPRYARRASRIATVSEFSRQDIAQQYSIPEHRIDVVFNGANEDLTPLSETESARHRKELTGGRPYFFFIGAQHPRKNILTLLRAFDQLRARGNDAALVLTGSRRWWTPEVEKAYRGMQYRKDVLFTGRIDTAGLRLTLGAAAALTYLSYFEGFGIPILEAFRCRVPVICSNATSLPEVAGDAALMRDPFDVPGIADAMESMLSNPSLRQEMIEKGMARLEIFSWDKTASLLWDSILRTAGQNTTSPSL